MAKDRESEDSAMEGLGSQLVTHVQDCAVLVGDAVEPDAEDLGFGLELSARLISLLRCVFRAAFRPPPFGALRLSQGT
jgi:hypothetical protein